MSNSPRHRHNLSLDLSDLPGLVQPSPPSNTLIITNLEDPTIFTAPNLEAIKSAINDQAPLHSFAPLKSFRRIIASFHSIPDATAVRTLLDGETVLGSRVRVYFGEPTKLEYEDQHLQAPKSQKLFFISPPPSPPHGWEVRDEAPPNKEVHAEDLASALSRLHATRKADYVIPSKEEQEQNNTAYQQRQHDGQIPLSPTSIGKRSRSSTVVFDPVDHGYSPDLPAISVVEPHDEGGDDDGSPMEGQEKTFVHTARPPVELME